MKRRNSVKTAIVDIRRIEEFGSLEKYEMMEEEKRTDGT